MLTSRLLLVTLALFASLHASAGWKDVLKTLSGDGEDGEITAEASQVTGLSTDQMVAGLKQALEKSTEVAVQTLGREGGFLNNPTLRIPMPEQLQWAGKGLRKLGHDEYADQFVTTMNTAAEQAVPMALEQFKSAIDAMTLDDAQNILNGPDDAATQYFRAQSGPVLRAQFLPIIEETTAGAGVTAAYKNMTAKLGSVSSFLNPESVDVDTYIADKALDGLFQTIALEEAKIRENPVARSTELLKKVFGGN